MRCKTSPVSAVVSIETVKDIAASTDEMCTNIHKWLWVRKCTLQTSPFGRQFVIKTNRLLFRAISGLIPPMLADLFLSSERFVTLPEWRTALFHRAYAYMCVLTRQYRLIDPKWPVKVLIGSQWVLVRHRCETELKMTPKVLDADRRLSFCVDECSCGGVLALSLKNNWVSVRGTW